MLSSAAGRRITLETPEIGSEATAKLPHTVPDCAQAHGMAANTFILERPKAVLSM